jgi:hypothetical protein
MRYKNRQRLHSQSKEFNRAHGGESDQSLIYRERAAKEEWSTSNPDKRVVWRTRTIEGIAVLLLVSDFSPILEFLVPYLSVAVSGNAACQRLEVHRHFRVNTRRMFRNTQS